MKFRVPPFPPAFQRAWLPALTLFTSVCFLITLRLLSAEPVNTSLEAAPTAPPGADNRKTLLMHYMPWYETPSVRGGWGKHWTGPERQHNPDTIKDNGLPDIWSHYHPLIGLYDSSDPDVLECHLLQMKLAGIDGVIVDWYGIGKAADYPSIHNATQAMFQATGRIGMKFGACYEDRTIKLKVERKQLPADQVNAHLRETFRWMHDNWFNQPNYFRHDGRPVALMFGPIYANRREQWAGVFDTLEPRPLFFALHHLWKPIGADGGFSWIHGAPWTGYPDSATIRQRLKQVYNELTVTPEQLIVSALPGFNDVYVERFPELDHRDGQTLAESLAVCMDGPWPIVQLVTWNDYGEGTMIEPTHEFGYTFLEIIQESRQKEAGAAFPFTADDLRLPHRLFNLRKEGASDSATLNAISAALASGDTARARLLLK